MDFNIIIKIKFRPLFGTASICWGSSGKLLVIGLRGDPREDVESSADSSNEPGLEVGPVPIDEMVGTREAALSRFANPPKGSGLFGCGDGGKGVEGEGGNVADRTMRLNG